MTVSAWIVISFLGRLLCKTTKRNDHSGSLNPIMSAKPLFLLGWAHLEMLLLVEVARLILSRSYDFQIWLP